MKPTDIYLGPDALSRPDYRALIVDPTGTPTRITQSNTEEIKKIIISREVSTITMNCNQDVLLIVQQQRCGVFNWQPFSREDMKSLRGEHFPVAINNAADNEPLFLATLNRESLATTLDTGNLIMWSMSRNKLWIKWETSGDYLKIWELLWDPLLQAFWAKVTPLTGGVCHEKIDENGNLDENGEAAKTCFRRVIYER
jgi:phosphoribosyl-AMP cyclohydrolase